MFFVASVSHIPLPKPAISFGNRGCANDCLVSCPVSLTQECKTNAKPFTASHLMSYDIVLITRQRFEQEMCPFNSQGFSNVPCTCSSTFDCHCRAAIDYHSPLRDLHFTRVIVDEGHEFGGRRNNAYYALSRLRVDRRWIVSGTPASGLLGVEVGSAACESSDLMSSPNVKENMLEARKKEPGFLQECKDLESLRAMITGFLDLKPWSNAKHEDPAHWGQYIMPYANGKRKPSSLRNLLSSLILRHRIEDVEADVQLPQLYNRVVYLEPSWQDKLSQNAFIISLIVNAVTSERVDEDYMFHSRNRPVLYHLIGNLRQSGFYWSSFSPEELSKTLHIATRYLQGYADDRKDERSSDYLLLNQVIQIGEIILASPSWKVFSELHEMGLYVHDFPLNSRESWSLVPRKDEDLMLVGATQLTKIQKWVDSHLYEGEQLLGGLKSLGKNVMDKTWQQLRQSNGVGLKEEASAEQAKSTPYSPTKRKKIPTSIAQPKLTEHFTVSKARASSGLGKLIGNKKKSAEASIQPLKSALKPSKPVAPLDRSSQLFDSALSGTASAKLSYLLDQITVLHKDEKILIFYEGDHIAYYIAQAFDLMGIRYLIYARTLDLALKSAYIATFNSTPKFRVMLMDIKEAAHGLHVASASRIFFVNPVWQPNIEAQAIKRAHRIGQIRPVYVETLVLRDTLEDQMLKRRKCMTVEEHQKAEKSLLDDEPMRTIIENARLLPVSESESSNIGNQIAGLKFPVKLFGQDSSSDVDPENPYADLIFPIETAKTRKLGSKLNREGDTERLDTDSHVQIRSSLPNDRKRKAAEVSTVHGDDEHANPPAKIANVMASDDTEGPRAKKKVGFSAMNEHESLPARQAGSYIDEMEGSGPSYYPTASSSGKRVAFDVGGS